MSTSLPSANPESPIDESPNLRADGNTPFVRATSFFLRNFALARAFRGDRLLFWVTLLLSISVLMPLFVCRYLPFADLPNNVGAAALLFDADFGHGVPAKYYWVNYSPFPYWTAYIFMAALSAVFNVVVASKALVGLLVILLPLVTMRLLIALKRDPRLGLFAFVLSWEHNLYFGWVSYLLGMSLAILAIAWLIEAKTLRDTWKIFGLSLLIALTHAEAVAFLGLAVLMLLVIKRPFLRSFWQTCLGASGALLCVLPWLSERMGKDPMQSGKTFVFDWNTPSYKLSKLAENTLDSVPTTTGQTIMAAGFLVLLLGPVFLSALPQRITVLAPPRGSALVALSAGALYLACPMAVNGPVMHTYTYPRFATFLLVGLLFLVRPRLDGRYAWALAPAVVTALACNAVSTWQMSVFGKSSAPFQEVVDAVRPNSTVLTLTYNEWDPLFTGFYPLGQFHAYLAGMKHGYDPLLFDYPANPLQYNAATRLPGVLWDRPSDYSFEKQGHFYDYILVQGASVDPVHEGSMSTGQIVKRVVKAGVWTLYSVQPPT